MQNNRRSDFDVTNTVQVSSPGEVCGAVKKLFTATWPGAPFDAVVRGFDRLEEVFSGRDPEYHALDTVYHDLQHTLDITLAMARLCAGYERQAPPGRALGAERATIGLLVALFHDVGYLRERTDTVTQNGAELTATHVARGARFLEKYLPVAGFDDWVPIATQIIHFTGYEVPLDSIQVFDERDRKLGHLLGTADMIAQMADRCYLEKCRDRLYPEFVLGGYALPLSTQGGRNVKYASGLDLLRQTPQFIAETRARRLDGAFGGAYHYLEVLFDGVNPYMDAIDRNVVFLKQVLRSESWRMLRRNPPVFAAGEDPLGTTRGLAMGYIRRAWSQ
ncbi:MAG: HD domain-containing protein [Steroidobacteraceae bacterium]|nr:HD domain-containing protein [Steroidobacteraceae bacterium]